MSVPLLLALPLGREMPGVLLPGMDGSFVGEIGNRDAQAAGAPHGFGAEAARLPSASSNIALATAS